ncbi:MAG: ion channel [Candidatus Electrothrix aestuarii]|uniref:Ion channel n=1 Tax=Candidatus Electrothrix aestuarii TaxID=3062594 RepID=A0AAU8LQJ9_9BACT|nr:ion channel [Candidatus Electrothrix aestuarii]WPD24806.1 MAG: ion channel [Candidatus Electrothrix sp. GW3-3]
MKNRLKRLYLFFQRENLLYLLGLILGMILCSSALIAFFEEKLSFSDGVWWSIVTLTTVGYGDISPATPAGRILAVVIMFFGIGLLGTLSAGLASILINRKMRENRGMCPATFEEHIIICEWNHRAKAILNELRADPQTEQTPVVLIADIEEVPLEDPYLVFIRGVVCEETLEKAHLKKAQTIIVLGDDTAEPTARDAKVVLTTLAVESMNPHVYSVVELVDKKNEAHCLRANADEIIIGSELSSHLIASAASDHGISRVVTELLSSRYGNELYSMPVPESMAGKNFLDVFIAMKTEHNITVFGVQKGRAGEFIPNPNAEYCLAPDDLLLVISKDRIRK